METVCLVGGRNGLRWCPTAVIVCSRVLFLMLPVNVGFTWLTEVMTECFINNRLKIVNGNIVLYFR